MELHPENVTLHTLTVKRAAGFGTDPVGILAGTADAMVEFAQRRFGEEGYFPYYLYRQRAPSTTSKTPATALRAGNAFIIFLSWMRRTASLPPARAE
jgi:hypothetical protein